MSAPVLRPSAPGDERGLKELWRLSFGDGDEFIGLFFELMYSPGSATVLEADGKLVSAMYTVSGLSYSAPGVLRGLLYAYALGTVPEYRGRGFGAMVTRELSRAAFGRGHGEVALLPSSGGLRGWYESRLGAKTGFWVKELTLRPPFAARSKCRLAAADAALYNKAREAMLDGKPHVSFDGGFMQFAGLALKLSGGGLFLLDTAAGVGCAAVEREGGALSVKELLIPGGDIEAAAAAIALAFPASGLTLRCPVFQEGLEYAPPRDFASLIRSGGETVSFAGDGYFGFALD